MLKLMIAEDEALERKAIRFLLNRYYVDDLEVVCEVTNGQDAVEKAREFAPDIVLMDINMPVLDGLEAGAEIKNARGNTEIVILTAFNYFDYAKRAIRLGVDDYLLKPYSDEEFCASIDKLIIKISIEDQNERRREEIYKKYEESIPFVEKEMVTNIVYGVTLSKERLEQYRKILDIGGSRFCCLIFRTLDAEENADIRKIKELLKTRFDVAIGHMCLNDIVIFLFDDRVEEKVLGGRFEKLIGEITESCGGQLRFGRGCCNESVEELYLSYRQAKLALDGAAPARGGLPKGGGAVDISGRIINEDLDGALAAFDGLLSRLNAVSGGFEELSSASRMLLGGVAGNVMEFMGRSQSGDGLFSDIGWGDVSDIRDCGHIAIKGLIGRISSYKENNKIEMLEKVKSYIGRNYMKEISLEDMAAYVSISSYYLSRIFKKVEGINFKDYLIGVRMEKAKNMLKKEKKSIKEVGILVGYSDQNYFSKAFKKYANLSPLEYKNL